MRVGVVTTSYPRWPDDPAGSFVAGHVDWLCRTGHRVDVVCAGAPPEPTDGSPARTHHVWQPGVRLHPVPAPAGLFYAGGAPEALAARPHALLAAARFTAALSATVARLSRRWDLAFAHWLVPGAAALAACAPRLPVVGIGHSGDVHLMRRLGLVTPVAALLARPRLGLAFVSRHVRDHFLAAAWPTSLRRSLRARSLITPMGIDVARLRAARAHAVPPDAMNDATNDATGDAMNDAATGAMDTSSPAGSRPHTVLFLGRLVPVKGIRVLLDAVERLVVGTAPEPGPERLRTPAPAPRPVRPFIRLIIAGHGPDRAALEARADELRARGRGLITIHLPGEVRGADRDRLLASADILVLPSVPVESQRTEGLPVTVLEAMAAGVPVVASRTGGLGELPSDILTSVPPGDADALARALARCLGDPVLRQRRARAAGRWVEQHDWARVGTRLWAHATSALPLRRGSGNCPTS